jgi:hypothetical protein
MKSPFPGMDPYLERHWLDVHTRLVTYVADWLNEHLPAGLVAVTEERVAIESDDDRLHRAGPDVGVYGPSTAAPARHAGGVVLDAPYVLTIHLDPITERFVKVMDSSGEQLVSVIEIVSPTNKRGPGLETYVDKREEPLGAGVHVVEIDLVRRGDWRALMRPYASPVEADSPYRVVVYTASPNRRGYLYPATMRGALPDVPIPLRAHDEPPRLPLQALVAQVYARGRYAQRINYVEPCDPALTPEDAAWAASLLAVR